jgi:predicted nucleic-acid-binding Zn-ribbon protein
MDEQQKARAALRQKYAETIRRLWVEPDDCPICGSNTWNTGDLIQTQLRHVDDASTPSLAAALMEQPLPQVYVYLPVTCVICGYSMFFHTGVLDVRDEETVKAVPPVRVPRADPK